MLPATDAKNIEDKSQKQSEASTVSVVGCERNGILHACLLAEAGFRVICFDSDRALMERVSKGKISFLKHEIEPVLRKGLGNGRIKTANSLEEVAAQSSAILVTTSATINEKGRVEYSSIEKTLKGLSLSLRRDTLIIIVSIMGVGVTENILKEVLESVSGLKAGVDFYFAYSPTPFPEEQTLKSLIECKRIVAAQDKNSLEKASKIISAITREPPIKTLDIKTAEATVLFESMFRNASFAVTNELASLCEKVGIDYLAVQNLLVSDKSTFLKPKLSCDENYEALLMLLEEAENQNVKLQVSAAILEVNREALKRGINLVREALKSCGKTLRRTKIALLGFSQTLNAADTPKKSLKTFVKILESKGVRLSLYDPYFSRKILTDSEHPTPKRSLIEAVEGADCIVIFTGHDQFKRLNLRKLKLLTRMPAAIVDFEGILDPA
ncbi:MAG: nucleotide sugar dehydrogenase, partial [Candidatus Bathyarchaeia archaeon]